MNASPMDPARGPRAQTHRAAAVRPRSRPRPAARPVALADGEGATADSVALPFFGRSDWLAFGLATLVVLAGYLLTVAPDVTLEDSGEMAVAAHYAGVPHPPGYPVWTLYSWLVTKLLPFSNMAWRVAVGSAMA